MIRFNCDYAEGAHPRILQKLMETNMEQTPGYGQDAYCTAAAERIKSKCQCDDADVHFLMGGTQANLTVIAAALRPYQAVVCADSAHIHVHETGSIEACGHKILALADTEGKISAAQIQAVCEEHLHDSTHEHTVQPKLVYISNPTELGSIYYKDELSAISRICRQYGLYLFMDGARLGYGLCAADNDLDLPAISKLCDVFYIGGTKVGALFGEAVVILHPALQQDFRYLIKQKGGMLAKGRLLGIQFYALFQDDLYFQLASHANRLAMQIKQAFQAKNVPLLLDHCTNQQFVILPDTILKKLDQQYTYDYHHRVDEAHSAVRFCTSWATKPEDVEQLCKDIDKLCQ